MHSLSANAEIGWFKQGSTQKNIKWPITYNSKFTSKEIRSTTFTERDDRLYNKGIKYVKYARESLIPTSYDLQLCVF